MVIGNVTLDGYVYYSRLELAYGQNSKCIKVHVNVAHLWHAIKGVAYM